MFVPTYTTVKLANRNTGHAQEIGIILCCFNNCYIIYTVGPVYHCPGRPFNTVSSGAPTFYVGFQNVTSEPLEHCDFFDSQGRSWRSPHHPQNNLDHIQTENFQIQR